MHVGRALKLHLVYIDLKCLDFLPLIKVSKNSVTTMPEFGEINAKRSPVI